jgi:hypothetical protein
MTPTDEAEFIDLWTAGLTCPEIARRLGIPPGTARSRAYHLQQRGLITVRPKGGRRTPVRPGDPPAPARAPATTPADSALPTRDPPAITMVAVPELRELITRFSGLEARVVALEHGTRDPTRTTPAPAGTRTPGTIKQWTVRLSQPLIEAVKAQAATEAKEPSHLVEELLWQALTDRRSLTP